MHTLDTAATLTDNEKELIDNACIYLTQGREGCSSNDKRQIRRAGQLLERVRGEVSYLKSKNRSTVYYTDYIAYNLWYYIELLYNT